jgi:hypothetical protein
MGCSSSTRSGVMMRMKTHYDVGEDVQAECPVSGKWGTATIQKINEDGTYDVSWLSSTAKSWTTVSQKIQRSSLLDHLPWDISAMECNEDELFPCGASSTVVEIACSKRIMSTNLGDTNDECSSASESTCMLSESDAADSTPMSPGMPSEFGEANVDAMFSTPVPTNLFHNSSRKCLLLL